MQSKWAMLVLVAACGGSSAPTVTPTPITPDAGAIVVVDAAMPIDAALPVDATPPDAPPVAEVPLELPKGRPPVKGAVTRIAQKETKVVNGIAIKFASSGHKHGANVGMWGFTFTKNGKTVEEEIRFEGEQGAEAELAVHGTLFVFRHVDYTTFDIVLAAAKAPKPLDMDGCFALVDGVAKKAGLPEADGGSSAENGVVRRTADKWVGFCGQYTKRVWFDQPRRSD